MFYSKEYERTAKIWGNWSAFQFYFIFGFRTGCYSPLNSIDSCSAYTIHIHLDTVFSLFSCSDVVFVSFIFIVIEVLSILFWLLRLCFANGKKSFSNKYKITRTPPPLPMTTTTKMARRNSVFFFVIYQLCNNTVGRSDDVSTTISYVDCRCGGRLGVCCCQLILQTIIVYWHKICKKYSFVCLCARKCVRVLYCFVCFFLHQIIRFYMNLSRCTSAFGHIINMLAKMFRENTIQLYY